MTVLETVGTITTVACKLTDVRSPRRLELADLLSDQFLRKTWPAILSLTAIDVVSDKVFDDGSTSRTTTGKWWNRITLQLGRCAWQV